MNSLDRSDSSERNLYMRLALEKLLCSRISQYFRESELKKLKDSFISIDPGITQHTFFVVARPSIEDNFRDVVGNFTLFWQLLKEKEQDKDGNLWSTYVFCFSLSIRESYSLQGDLLERWIGCLGALEELSNQIKSLNIPNKICEMTHTSEQRIKMEKTAQKEKIEKELSNFFSLTGRKHIVNMRVGGKEKLFPSKEIDYLLKDRENEEYVVRIKLQGSRWNARFRSYVVKIKEELKMISVCRKS